MENAGAVIELNPEIINASQTVLDRYFETLNAGEFEATAALFAEQGVLYPPFEDGVVGPEAIATYLQAEAVGIQVQPLKRTAQQLEDGNIEYEVRGKVQTALFGVNVAWCFVLTPQSELLAVSIKLLATLEELLTLKR